MFLQESPDDHAEETQPDGAKCRSVSIQCGGLPPANCFCNSSFLLSLAFVFFDQSGTGGKDGGKCKEKPSQDWAKLLGDKSSKNGDRPAESEAHQVLVPFGPSERGQM